MNFILHLIFLLSGSVIPLTIKDKIILFNYDMKFLNLNKNVYFSS